MCRVLEVSRSGFHAWIKRAPSGRAREDARLTDRIREIHAANPAGLRIAARAFVHRRSRPTKAELRAEVFDYIEVFFNRQSCPRTLGQLFRRNSRTAPCARRGPVPPLRGSHPPTRSS